MDHLDTTTSLLFPSCFQCDWDHCELSEWVDTWAPHYLTPLSIISFIRNDDMESSLEHNHLLDLLQLGHAFALVAP